jgi:hypothetical protein
MTARWGLLLALLCAAPRALAHPGLDLLVLVDRSASTTRDARLSDLWLRVVVELLVRNATVHHVTHRLAVVSFGSNVRVDLPFTAAARGLAGSARHVQTSLGDTDVLAGFVAAEALFRSLPRDEERRRAIVLLTDGVPYVPRANVVTYERDLRRFVSESFPVTDTSIDVFVLSGPNPERHAALWRDLARGRVHRVSRDRSDAVSLVHGVVGALAGTRTGASRRVRHGEETVEVLVLPPYLDLVVFDVIRETAGQPVAIHPPDALRPLSTEALGVEEVRLGDTLSSIAVRRPAPGAWIIRSPGRPSGVKVFSQQFFPRGTLIRPRFGQALRQYDRAAVAYRVVDGDGRPLRESPEYPLSVQLSLVKPNGERLPMDMAREASLGPGAFEACGDSEFDVAGRYWTEVVIGTRDLENRPVTVFRDRWSGFTVTRAILIDCRIGPIREERGLILARFRTRVECRDERAKPIELQSLLTGTPAELIRASVTREGRPVASTLDLRYLGVGAFEGQLRAATTRGAYGLTFMADRAQLAPAYNVRFVPKEVLFSRRLHGLGPIGLAVLMIAVASLLLAHFVWPRT